MFLRSAIKSVSAFFLIKLIIDKAFSGKLRFQSVFIEKEALLSLTGNGRSLFFSSDYDGRPFMKDSVTLLGYLKEGNNPQMKRLPLKALDRGEVFNNEKNYSRYELKREDIQKITDRYGDEAVFFIFKPVDYKPDNEYVAYQIIPADQYKVPLRKKQHLNAPLPQFMSRVSEAAPAPESENTTVSLALRTGLDYEVAAVLNPSPPATSDLDYER